VARKTTKAGPLRRGNWNVRFSWELALSLAALVLMGLVAASLGSSNRRDTGLDTTRTSLSAGPAGTRGLAEGLEASGIQVSAWRRPTTALGERSWSDSTLFVWLAPSRPLSSFEAVRLRDLLERGGHLLLAGPQTSPVVSCMGLTLRPLVDRATVAAPGNRVLSVTTVLDGPEPAADSLSAADSDCQDRGATSVDTLLAGDSLLIALTADFGEGGRLLVISDDRLLSNELLRSSDAGTWALGLFRDLAYPEVVFEEYHHGFGSGGSLGVIAWHWVTDTAWGMALWQLVAVALITLAAASIRFGPPLREPRQSRRSTLEHVDALASVLSSSGGQTAAVQLLVKGLRRRLGLLPAGGGHEASSWLRQLDTAGTSPRAHEAVERLISNLERAGGEASVKAAAEATDVLWEELHK